MPSCELPTLLKRRNLRYYNPFFIVTSLSLTFHNKIVKRAELHLLLATKARSYLKAQVQSSKEVIKEHFMDKGLDVPSIGACPPPASRNVTIHFSYDMAQQV